MKEIKLEQSIINAYESYVWNVTEAVKFVEMGSGQKHKGVFDILKPILKTHEKELYKTIEEEMSKSKNN